MAGDKAGDRSGNFLVNAATLVVQSVATAWNKLTADGHVTAFGRQGADELAQALKAFPESIQVHEPGTILDPTQGEIAASRKDVYRSPSEFSRSNTVHGKENSVDRDRLQQTIHRSPSEIAAERRAMPEQHQTREQEHSREME